jgi:hypothetical protein
MPALFAYLIAIGLLLGGGYGALSWLAAPEPVKVALKVNPKSLFREQAKSEARSSEPIPPAVDDSDRAASGSTATISKENQPSPQSRPSATATEPGAKMEASERTPDLQNPSANAEVTQAEVKQPAEAGSQDGAPVSSGRQKVAVAPTTVEKAQKPRAARQARGRPEQSGLTLMTLRTIEFPDGHRVTQLIPYRGGRALAFQPVE